MSNVTLNAGAGGATLGTDTVTGVDYQIVKIGFSLAGAAPVQVSASNALPVVQTGALPAGANTIGAVTQASGPWSENITQLAGTAIDVNSGNKSAGTLRVVLATDQPTMANAQPVLQSGSWTVTANAGSGTFAVSGTVTSNAGTGTFNNQQSNVTTDYDTGAGTQTMTMFGLALPATGGAVAGGTATNPIQVSLANTGANATAVKVDGSAVTQPISGTVTANIGTSGSLALDASVTGLQVAQGSTTSGQKGGLTLGAVTTAAPTYTTAQSSPLSLTTAGALRVDNSGVTQPVSGTVTTTPPANASTNVAQLAGTTTDTNSGVKSAGTLRVVLATDQPQLTNKLLVTPDANSAVNVAQLSGTAADTNSGNKSAGTLRVVLATDQPTMSNGQPAIQSGTWTVQPGNTANTTPWLVTDTPGTSGGLSFSYVLSAASNNKTQAKGSAGQLFTVVVTNTNAAARYLKIFNNTSAGVTMGTTSADFQFVIPGNTAGAGIAINIDKGIALGTGITYAITAGVALNDNTSVAANEVSVLIGYK